MMKKFSRLVGNVNTTATADFRGNIMRVGLNYQFH
jgi:hypothetical protein